MDTYGIQMTVHRNCQHNLKLEFKFVRFLALKVDFIRVLNVNNVNCSTNLLKHLIMNQWVVQLFEFHRNIVKDEAIISKHYVPVNNEKEIQDTEEGLKALHRILQVERVDRRSARITGVWNPETKLTLVTKRKGCILTKLGYQNKTGYYLYPEEALYLIETNRLELLWKTITMSIQQAYSVLSPIITLDKYLIYRKLISNSFKVTIQHRESKRTFLSDFEDKNPKKICQRPQEYTSNTSYEENIPISNYTDESFRDILASLKMSGPKKWAQRNECENVAYNAQLSDNSTYKVFVCKSQKFDPKWPLTEEHSNNLFGLIQTDDVAFYRFSSINLPDLGTIFDKLLDINQDKKFYISLKMCVQLELISNDKPIVSRYFNYE